jgi:hypothetical protein
VYDRWVEVKAIIDLNQDWVRFYYDGVQLFETGVISPTLGTGYRWTGGVFGGGTGALNIAAVDLYANNTAQPVFYDDISLEPFSYELVGRGCPGTLPVSQFTLLNAARVGQAFVASFDNMPANAAFHTLGWSDQNSLLGPLPLDLGAFGAPGCKVFHSVDNLLFLLGTQGSAAYALPIPPVAAFAGYELIQQALLLDPAANALGAVVSNAMHLRILP